MGQRHTEDRSNETDIKFLGDLFHREEIALPDCEQLVNSMLTSRCFLIGYLQVGSKDR